MKIYFTASVTGGRKYLAQYQKIVESLKNLGHEVLSEQTAKEKLNSDKKLTPLEIFQREKRHIDLADCFVAEVTEPSTGVGSEISYALNKKKHVLALFYKDSENLLSPMIAGNSHEDLFLEHYDDDNFEMKIKKFIRHVVINGIQRVGKLIVIDGGDGSGKQTQSQLLVQYLKKKNLKVKYFDFPQYYSSFHGKIVGRFLAGEFGKMDQVSPYLISLAYALDRASAREEMEDWLTKGGIIISNRYATSNMAHQGARISKEKRKEFIDWVDELEYRVHKIPREDLVIYLYVPWKIGLKLTAKKGERGYVKGKKLDIAETDIKHRQESEKMYLWLCQSKKNWVKINCVNKKGEMRTREEIHQEILEVLKKRKVIK